jgi:hypothetical protein
MVAGDPSSSSSLMTSVNLGGGSSSSSGGGGAALTAGTGLPAVPVGAGGGPGASATSPVGVLGTVSVSRFKRGSGGIPLLPVPVDRSLLVLDGGPAGPVDFAKSNPSGGLAVAQDGSVGSRASVYSYKNNLFFIYFILGLGVIELLSRAPITRNYFEL